MLEEIAAGRVGLLSVWLLGVSMGMTACTVTCLPFMGTWALGRAGGSGEALLHTATFLAGRVTAYTLLGALAGMLGMGLANALGGGLGNAAIGAASILAGVWLALRPGASCGPSAAPQRPAGPPQGAPVTARSPHARTNTRHPFPWEGAGGRVVQKAQPIRLHRTGSRRRDGLPPLFLGAALSLTPCTPLASLLALAANAGAAPQGAAYGLAFGLGAAVTPIVVLVPLAGHLGRNLRAERSWLLRWLTWGAAAVLVALGVRRMFLAFA